MTIGVEEIRQQTVRATTGLTPHPLDADVVDEVARACQPRIGSPADLAVPGLAVGTANRNLKAATGEGDSFSVLPHRTGKMVYNDHSLGTPACAGHADRPPSSWSGSENSRPGGRCRPFWFGLMLPTKTAPPAGGALLSPVSLLLSRSTVVELSFPPSRHAFNVAASSSPMTDARGVPILFGRDCPFFVQILWPITPVNRGI
jgi:hypothetical protein